MFASLKLILTATKIYTLTLYFTKLSTHLTQALYKPDHYQPPDSHFGGNGHQKTEQRIDQHAHSQKVDVSVTLGQYSEGYLSYHIAVEKRTENITLNVGRP